MKDTNWDGYKSKQSKYKGGSPEEYDCCQEDGTPRCSKQQSRQRRGQRRTAVGIKVDELPPEKAHGAS